MLVWGSRVFSVPALRSIHDPETARRGKAVPPWQFFLEQNALCDVGSAVSVLLGRSWVLGGVQYQSHCKQHPCQVLALRPFRARSMLGGRMLEESKKGGRLKQGFAMIPACEQTVQF